MAHVEVYPVLEDEEASVREPSEEGDHQVSTKHEREAAASHDQAVVRGRQGNHLRKCKCSEPLNHQLNM